MNTKWFSAECFTIDQVQTRYVITKTTQQKQNNNNNNNNKTIIEK